MKKRLTLLAVLGFGATLAQAQNRILDTGNQYFNITNFGPGPATLSSLGGLPLGTWPEGTGTGELGLKVVVLNPSTGGTSTSTVIVSGRQRGITFSTLTTSGAFSAGVKSLDIMCLSGTFTFTDGTTVTLTSGQSFGRSVAPDTLPAINYTISTGGTTQAITTQ